MSSFYKSLPQNFQWTVNGFKSAGIWPFDSNILEQLIKEESHKLISPEKAINVESEIQGALVNDPDKLQPSTSGTNNPVQFDNDIELCPLCSPKKRLYVLEGRFQ